MKSKWTMKLIAVILSFLMTVTSLPAAAFADERPLSEGINQDDTQQEEIVTEDPAREEVPADEAIEEVRDGNRNVASSYTYDIKVLAADGMTELEPAEDSKVKVTFSIAEAADENLETDVYHLTEDSETGELTAEKLDILNNEFDEDAIISEETSDDSVMSDKSAAALFLEIILQR